QRVDLLAGVAVEGFRGRGRMCFVREVPEARHPRPVEERLRVLQPERDPVGPQPLLGHEEVGRRAARVLTGPQLADYVTFGALQLREERLGLLETVAGELRRLRGQVREA